MMSSGTIVTADMIGSINPTNGQIITGTAIGMDIHGAGMHHHGTGMHHHGVGMRACMYEAPAPPITQQPGPGGMTSVPLLMQKRGSAFAFPNTYTLALRDKLSAAEFTHIIETLNTTTRQHGPSTGGFSMCLLLCPCTAMCTIMSMKSQYETMTAELERTCNEINGYYKGHVNLRLVSSSSNYGGTIRIDLEVV